ncbi:MAG: tetratricopeptide repeat protein [Thermodesulfobacteriota bacterium]|nr:tetratricopeptide repeat protein [Thermodesulfobacteriota bacterium]
MKTALDEQHLLAKVRDYSAQFNVNPTSDIFIPLAQCYLALGLTEAALDVARRGVAQNPDNIAGRLLLADLLGKIDEYDDAIATYEQVLQDDHNNEQALVGLVRLDIQQCHYDRALGRLDQIREVYPQNNDIEALEKQLDELLNSAGDENGDNSESVPLMTATMAELYLKQGLKEKAIDVYQSLLQQQPNNELFRSRLADLAGSSVDCVVPSSDSLMFEDLKRWIEAIDRRRKHV